MMILIMLLMLLMPMPVTVKPSADQVPGNKWLVTNQSTLRIAGSSNVNEFECVILQYAGQDVLEEKPAIGSNKTELSGRIILKSAGFDCHNAIMTKDLRKTIQADAYPDVLVEFLSLKMLNRAGSWQSARGVVEISLAGISRQYEIDAVFKEEADNKASLKGSWEFSFSDFNMDPPTKMMGAIKVRDCLTVHFKLQLEKASAGNIHQFTGGR